MAALLPQGDPKYAISWFFIAADTDSLVEHTALVGQVNMEINCLPVENAEYRRIMDRRTRQAVKPKRETKLLTGIISSHGGNLLAPGTLGSSGNFDTFIVRNSAISLPMQTLIRHRNTQGQIVESS